MSRNQVRKPIVRFVCLAVGLAAFLAPGTAFGQTTGKVIGTVTDQDTGQPLVGAQIVVDGTNLGNVTNEDGYFFINNVPVGIERITAQYLGYQTLTQEERVLAGQTMTVDFALSSEVVQAEGIVAVIEREPLVARDNTISKSRFTADEARALPVDDLTDVVDLGAGIYTDNERGGFVIRGGRSTESATYVDGALVTNFSTQQNSGASAVLQTAIAPGTGPIGTVSGGLVGQFGVEEVDVITGGFNAEFGHAQSGVVNVVTRDGGSDFHGSLRFTTDGQFGTDGYTSEELAAVDFVSTGLEEEKCCGYNSLQASIGGPIIPEKLTFFGSLDASGAADFTPRSAGFNPATGVFNSDGSTDNILPGNGGDQTRSQAKLTSFLTPTSRLSATYLYSRDQFETFQESRGIRQYLSWIALRDKSHDFILGYDQQLFQTADRNLNLQVRGNYHIQRSFLGTPLSAPMAAIVGDALGDACGAGCDATGDTFEADFLNYRFDDVEFFFEDANPGDFPNIPQDTGTFPDAIFGHSDVFVTDGLSENFSAQTERRYGIRVDLDSQLNRVHRAKVGAEWNWVNLAKRAGELDSGQFADFYDVDPRVGAAYVQDRLDYGDLVIDLGLRWDHFDPNQMFARLPGLVPCEISAFPDICRDDAETVEGRTLNELSPRLGVAHPITDATQVRLSYGKFHQLPEFQHYYQSFSTDFQASLSNPNIQYGNPNLDYVETTAFEAGITHLISENLVLDVVGYNRDRRGAIRLDVFQGQSIHPDVSERRVFTNNDNGNVKGVDLTVSKRYSNYFSTDLAWSLQWARGTTSGPIDFASGVGFGRLFDPLFPGRLLQPPSEVLAEDFDRTHSINWQFNLRFPGDFQQGSAWGKVLSNFGAYVVYNAHSGEPFTRVTTEGQGEPLEGIHSSRLPWFHQGDLRVTKAFDLSQAFGVEVFASVINFLDIDNVVRVNETTGRADRTGFEDERSQDPVIGNQFLVEGGDGEYPFVLDQDILEEFRVEFGRQDLNGDGTITLEEGRESLRQSLIASGQAGNFQGAVFGDSPYNYGEPRQLRFGAELRF
ncbi:MAG TPA: TonB-dependent receptor [Gemmatimonadota bacterium]|nr:TonB-dependent receptor [Gemmatimonadota bacterium]